MSKELLTGSEAAAYGAKLARIEVLAYYPITPAFPAMERLSKFIDDGELLARFIRVESDHSALAAALGASLVGSRAFTVTNSQGLLYMTEVAYHVAGLRQPIVMAVANRALSAPHSRFPEQGDAISQGASGWIQLFCENNQEVLDNTLQAFHIAETCSLPVMLNYEGYIQSHTLEEVDIPAQSEVDAFIPHKRQAALDVGNPQAINTVTGPDLYMSYKFNQNEAMHQALNVIDTTAAAYAQRFGREYAGVIELDQMEDAEHAIVVMGSLVSETRIAVKVLRERGVKVGLVKVRAWRPFPAEKLRQALNRVERVTVLDKNIVFGLGGALGTEVKSALFGFTGTKVYSYVLGLGGRDVGAEDVRKIVEQSAKETEPQVVSQWYGL